MAWTSRDHDVAAIVLGRKTMGAAVRRARLRHGWSQRQLGWIVGYDQTTISRLETAKLKGMRFRMLMRLIGMLSCPEEFEIRDGGPAAPTRRLPGERPTT
jgi:transcriptional regulator with XRE-family HTH domain